MSMIWTKPSGLEITTNDNDATIKYCRSLGWVPEGEGLNDTSEAESLDGKKKTTKKDK